MNPEEQESFWRAYIEEAMSFAHPTMLNPIVEANCGLIEEIGELCGLIKRHARGDGPLDLVAVEKELGDILWYIVRELTLSQADRSSMIWHLCDGGYEDCPIALDMFANHIVSMFHGHHPFAIICSWKRLSASLLPGRTLEQIATNNLEKLRSRKARGAILGSGDNR